MMDFETLIQKIKLNNNIVDIVSDYVQLTDKGNNFIGNCPFHQEKTPSFFVSEDRQLYHCFGCGAGGDIFTFLQEIENISFIEAAKILAERAHIPWENIKKNNNNDLRNKLLEINKLTADFYHYLFNEMPVAEDARNYVFNKRKLNKEIVQSFLIGFAPDKKDLLLQFLKKKNFTEKEIIESGVVSHYNNQLYDRFRARVVFPIWNHLGQIVGFTGRILDDSKKIAKYLNSPQSIIFNKSQLLYGLFHAKTALREKKTAILVEGQMDVLTAHQFNYKNVLASSGTALTIDHLNILKRYIDTVYFAFDSDEAGIKALEKALSLAWGVGLRSKIILLDLEKGKDPDDYIRNNKDLWDKAIENAISAWDYYVLKWQEKEYKDNQQKLVKDFFQVIENIVDSLEKEFWFQNFAEKFSINLLILKEEYEKYKSNSHTVKTVKNEKNEKNEKMNKEELNDEDHLLALFLYFILSLKMDSFINFFPKQALDEKRAELYNHIIIYYTNNNFDINAEFSEKFENLLTYIKQDYIDYLNKLYFLYNSVYSSLSDLDKKKHLLNLAKTLKKRFIQDKIHKIKEDPNSKIDELNNLIIELNIINKYNF